MFDNIAALRFGKGQNNEVITNAMVSGEGEMMEFKTQVVAEGRVEDWMTEVLNEMRRTNRLITKEAIYFYCASGKIRSVTLYMPIFQFYERVNLIHLFINSNQWS